MESFFAAVIDKLWVYRIAIYVVIVQVVIDIFALEMILDEFLDSEGGSFIALAGYFMSGWRKK